MKAERCLAGINGSYFDKAFRPLGLVIDGGKPVHGRGSSPLLTGMVATDGRMVELLWKGEATRLRSMVDAIEAGPRLIDGKLPGTRSFRSQTTTAHFHLNERPRLVGNRYLPICFLKGTGRNPSRSTLAA